VPDEDRDGYLETPSHAVRRRFNWRIPLGFVLAPIPPCTLLTLVLAAIAGQWNGFTFFTGAMIVVSLVVSLTVGLPLYLLLRRYWRVRLVECLVGGAVSAAVLNLAIIVAMGSFMDGRNYSAGDSGGATYTDGKLTEHGRAVAIRDFVQQLLLGASIGFCFWGIALAPTPSTRRESALQPQDD
jgi:hypothetical protein